MPAGTHRSATARARTIDLNPSFMEEMPPGKGNVLS
jgi:hypothetical protein